MKNIFVDRLGKLHDNFLEWNDACDKSTEKVIIEMRRVHRCQNTLKQFLSLSLKSGDTSRKLASNPSCKFASNPSRKLASNPSRKLASKPCIQFFNIEKRFQTGGRRVRTRFGDDCKTKCGKRRQNGRQGYDTTKANHSIRYWDSI